MSEPEHLVRIKLEDGTYIDFLRAENKEIHICHGDQCVILPHGTGQQTFDLFTLLESFGKVEEETDATT